MEQTQVKLHTEESLNIHNKNTFYVGFHEAIGDTMSLAVKTPIHLHSIGLLSTIEKTKEAEINYLLDNAMEKVTEEKIMSMCNQIIKFVSGHVSAICLHH